MTRLQMKTQVKTSPLLLPSIGKTLNASVFATEKVLAKYPHLRGESRMGELAAKLARESFFGKDLMQKSMVMGFKDFPPLPTDSVNTLKQTILSVCPHYQCNRQGFEGIWKKCVDAINHACSKLQK